MRQFDARAKKLGPDVYLSGLSTDPDFALAEAFSDPIPSGYTSGYTSTYGVGGLQKTFHRQITKSGVRSMDFTNLIVKPEVRDFTLSMMAMPVVEGKVVIDSDNVKVTCSAYSYYTVSIRTTNTEYTEWSDEALQDYYDEHGEFPVIEPEITYEWTDTRVPFDNTCHYLGLSKTDTKFIIDVDGDRFEFIADSNVSENFVVFPESSPSLMYVDKVAYSEGIAVLDRRRYSQLVRSQDIAMIPHSTFTDWVFRYDTFEPRILTGANSTPVQNWNVIGLPLVDDAASVLRNRSEQPVEISYNGGETWVTLNEYEYLPKSVPNVIIRADDLSFEVLFDSFGSGSLNLAAAEVTINGNVYPYHRDEPTFYTNAEYNFSNASVTVSPTNSPIKTVEIFGKLSDEILQDLGATRVVKDGQVITPPSDFVDNVPHFYTITVNWDEPVTINPDADKFICINAMGLSITEQEPDESEQVFNVFAGNAGVQSEYQAFGVTEGSVTGGGAARIIDVQWSV